MLINSFPDMEGYVSNVGKEKLSTRKNPYFDIKMQVSPTHARKIRVMINNSTKRSLFAEKEESKTSIKLTGLSPTK